MGYFKPGVVQNPHDICFASVGDVEIEILFHNNEVNKIFYLGWCWTPQRFWEKIIKSIKVIQAI